jgi:hypothetical protein
MRRLAAVLFAAGSLCALAACSRGDAGDVNIGEPTPLGSAERIDRIQFLSNASSAVTRGEDAYRHQAPAAGELDEATRLIDLALKSATTGGAPVEASWETEIKKSLAQVKQGIDTHSAALVDDGFNKVKLYIDQAQQAASIEY